MKKPALPSSIAALAAALLVGCSSGKVRSNDSRPAPDETAPGDETDAPGDTPNGLDRPTDPTDSGDPNAVHAALPDAPRGVSNLSSLALQVAGPNVEAYRAKWGPASSTDCKAERGYGAEQGIGTPLAIDFDDVADGPVVVCVIGSGGIGRQSTGDATRVEWRLDRRAPEGMRIEPVTAPEGGAPLVVRWSAADEPVTGYTLGIAPARAGCPAPLRQIETTSTEATIEEALEPGGYVFCLQAADAAGNVGHAVNSGLVRLDTATIAHLLYTKGDAPTSVGLFHTHRQGAQNSWTTLGVPLTEAAQRFDGGASLSLAQDDTPHVAFVAVEPGQLGQQTAHLGVAKLEGEAFASRVAASLPWYRGSALASPVTLAHDGAARVLLTSSGPSGESQLLHVDAARAPESATALVTSLPADGAFHDGKLAVDSSGALHAVYVADGKLFHQKGDADGASWSERESIGDRACQRVTLAGLTIAPGTSAAAPDLAVAYLCSTVGLFGGAGCELRLARRAGERWSGLLVAELETERSCLPFPTNRPTVGIDAEGTAHVAYRTRVEADFDVAVVSIAGDQVGEPMPLGEASPRTGGQRLVVDSAGMVHVAFLTVDGIRLASGEPGGPYTVETVVAADGGVLELQDFAIGGGTGRTLRPVTP